MGRVKKQTVENLFDKGELVSYYDEGQRAGYVESVRGETVRIKPIGPKDSNIRTVNIPLKYVDKAN